MDEHFLPTSSQSNIKPYIMSDYAARTLTPPVVKLIAAEKCHNHKSAAFNATFVRRATVR